MFKHKVCSSCGSANHQKSGFCKACGATLKQLAATNKKMIVIAVSIVALLGAGVAYGANAYIEHNRTTNDQDDSTQISQGANVTLASEAPSPSVTPVSTAAPVPTATPAAKSTPNTKASTPTPAQGSTQPVQPVSTPVSTPAPTTTPVPQPTIAKLDDQTRIKLLASANQWDKVTLYDWILHPEDSSYCSVDFSVIMDIHNTYDYFTISNDFSDIKKAQDDLWKKGVGVDTVGVMTSRQMICDATTYDAYNSWIEKFRIALNDFTRLLQIYEQKIDYHS